MKVLLLNGSPHPAGCTFTALSEVESTLKAEGLETEIMQLGSEAIRGCIGCRHCKEKHRCVVEGDLVNRFLDRAAQADGFVIGTPVYYASPNGALIAALDRIFYAGSSLLVHKPAAALASARRAGTTAALDVIYKYFAINQMPIATSQYWPMVHGNQPADVRQDLEGLQTMRLLGRNLAWLMRCIDCAKKAGIDAPVLDEPREMTNFIR